MSGAWKELVKTFRQSYVFPVKAQHNWFPGHMQRGLRQMEKTLVKTDCIIEVHDARIPISGRNVHFRNHLTGHRPHILVLNKKDLAPRSDRKRVIEEIKRTDPNISDVIYTDCTQINDSGMNSVSLDYFLPPSAALHVNFFLSGPASS